MENPTKYNNSKEYFTLSINSSQIKINAVIASTAVKLGVAPNLIVQEITKAYANQRKDLKKLYILIENKGDGTVSLKLIQFRNVRLKEILQKTTDALEIKKELRAFTKELSSSKDEEQRNYKQLLGQINSYTNYLKVKL